MYASHPPVARRMATRATGLPATALTGLDLHQLDFNKRFRYLIVVPPLPRLSQREQDLNPRPPGRSQMVGNFTK
jgi:hypothetical protein